MILLTNGGASHVSPWQGLWDRLAGRLCARLAWKKIGLMLNWLNGQLSFSDGIEGRTNWVSGRVRDKNS